MAVPQDALERPLQVQGCLVEFIEVGLLVAGLRLGLVNVGHVQQGDRTSVLHLEVLQLLFHELIKRLLDISLIFVDVANRRQLLLCFSFRVLSVLLLVFIVAVGVVVVVIVGHIVWLWPGSWQGPGPVRVPQMVDLEADDGHGDVADHPVEEGGQQSEGGQDGSGRTAVVSAFQTDRLVVKDLDLLEHMILLQAPQNGAVDLAKELAGVERVLRDHDKAVIVQHIALN